MLSLSTITGSLLPSHQRRRRTLLLTAALSAIAVSTGLSVAFGSSLLGLDSGSLPGGVSAVSPTIGNFEPDQAALQESYQTSWGDTAIIWTVPTDTGVVCTFTQLDPTSDQTPTFDSDGPGSCPTSSATPTTNRLGFSADWHQTSAGWSVLIEGHISPGSNIVDVSVQLPSGAQSLTIDNGYFIGELTGSPSSGTLPDNATSIPIVGLDASGNTVTQTSVNNIPAPNYQSGSTTTTPSGG
jgi:hypothetical protein